MVGENLPGIVNDLVKRKFRNVYVNPHDLANVHRLKSGIILIFKDFKPGPTHWNLLDHDIEIRDHK